jgi:hypothetical protein
MRRLDDTVAEVTGGASGISASTTVHPAASASATMAAIWWSG